mgnify:CR=1 FL=1
MKKGVMKTLVTFVRPYRGYLIVSLFSAIISIALTLLGPVLVGEAIDLLWINIMWTFHLLPGF